MMMMVVVVVVGLQSVLLRGTVNTSQFYSRFWEGTLSSRSALLLFLEAVLL